MKGGWEMINIDNLSKQILSIYKIINCEMDSWNAIGQHWLQKYDNKFGVDFFLCKCSDIKGLYIASIPKYYQDAIPACHNYLGSSSTESKNYILYKNIFGKSEIKRVGMLRVNFVPISEGVYIDIMLNTIIAR
jgi:hypothetical protein